jgi:hypothetical protein
LSRRHVPRFIFSVREIPYNVNGKKLKIPWKGLISEGNAGLAKLTCPAEEKAILASYLRFYEVEAMLLSGSKVLSARL